METNGLLERVAEQQRVVKQMGEREREYSTATEQ